MLVNRKQLERACLESIERTEAVLTDGIDGEPLAECQRVFVKGTIEGLRTALSGIRTAPPADVTADTRN